MPKGANQKFKLYRLAQIMCEKTDETHYLTMPEIQKELEKYDIIAERRSLYESLKDLEEFGIEVEGERSGRGYRYHVIGRQFELAELKTLVSQHDAADLRRQVFVSGRIKTMNETVYYSVDTIYNAISQNKKIKFQYYQWNVKKEPELRHGGAYYHISPWGLLWDHENYYLIGYDSRAEQIRHYRVDKMLHILLSEEIREGKEEFQKIDMASYSKKSFGMFGGKEQSVKLLVENSLAGVIVDRFGKDVMMIPADADHFTVSVDVQVSSQFISWVFALGSQAKIVSPKNVVNQVRKEIEKLAEQYALPIENRREN